MDKTSAVRVLIAAVIYLALYPMASACGLMGPAFYAYAGTVVPLCFAFVWLTAAANMQCFGAAAVLNGVILIVGFLMGEGDLSMLVIMVVLTVLTEIVRKRNGYDTLKGVRRSFLPFAYSFYAYSSHWWTDTAGSLQAAAEEMPAGYAERMEPVIANIPVLILMLVLVIPVAMLGMRLAEKVLTRQTGLLR